MAKVKITFTGTRPLVMHNGVLADPLNPVCQEIKALSAKTKKTTATHEDMAAMEFAGSLYYDPELGPYIPGENLEKALVDAARMSNLGKALQRGLFIDEDVNPLIYEGPRDLKQLYAARTDQDTRQYVLRKVVAVQRARVMRTRPRFFPWAVSTVAEFDETQFDFESLRKVAETAGRYIGLGDYRPRYGRFLGEVELIG